MDSTPTPRPSARSVLIVLFSAALFGVVVSVVKGNGGGIRDAIGNTSAPWLMLPFVAAVVAGGRHAARAALVGTAASFSALAGFYVANSFVLDLGPHSWLHDLSLTVQSGRMFFALAVISGPLFGALGGWWNRTHSTRLAVLVAALLVAEPLASFEYGSMRHSAYGSAAVVGASEFVLGLGACAVAVALTRRLRPPVNS
jgi:hypothetical protein